MYIGWYIGRCERNLTGCSRRVQGSARSSFIEEFPIVSAGRCVPPCGIAAKGYVAQGPGYEEMDRHRSIETGHACGED